LRDEVAVVVTGEPGREVLDVPGHDAQAHVASIAAALCAAGQTR
jgi:hypothetical protein